MKNTLTILITISLMICMFFIGMDYNQDTIEKRLENIDSQKCYSDKDIEYILFGESQL